MKRLLLTDLDGTIRRPASGAKFISNPEDQEVIPEAFLALNKFKREGLRIIGITNQGGVHYGYKSLEDCITEQSITLQLFPQLSCLYFCPDLGDTCYKIFRLSSDDDKFERGSPRGFPAQGQVSFGVQQYSMSNLIVNQQLLPDYNFRKPSPGMLLWAILDQGDWRIDECLYTGDRPEDKEAADILGIDFLTKDEFWKYKMWGILDANGNYFLENGGSGRNKNLALKFPTKQAALEYAALAKIPTQVTFLL